MRVANPRVSIDVPELSPLEVSNMQKVMNGFSESLDEAMVEPSYEMNPGPTDAPEGPEDRRAGKNFTCIAIINGESVNWESSWKALNPKEIFAEEKPLPYTEEGDPLIKARLINYVHGHPEANGWLLEEGPNGEHATTNTFLDAKGNRYTESQVVWKNDKGEKMEKFPKSTAFEVKKFLKRGQHDFYTQYGKCYEILPKKDSDTVAMWKFAKYLIDNGLIASGVVNITADWKQLGCLIIPYKSGDTFSLVAFPTRNKKELVPIKIPTGTVAPTTATRMDSDMEGLF